jgi:hypothetical protein
MMLKIPGYESQADKEPLSLTPSYPDRGKQFEHIKGEAPTVPPAAV